ncbi:ATP-binding cassette domain-containing protein [Anaerocolumna sedimenticola]|uniref:ATP-binding cassette domain-containing protein n=1 Tax=Anaerocolumna sedimenticola TaxID=2696063 RepID=A0A6P1TRD6_9FIRM|nr:ATP-binding cassette domain-containing protein [Anaerocolumna sedimenticola]QHQ62819.1 ATP-binding cassette domain-containing protein [Anaerocolumna sedimenticola]
MNETAVTIRGLTKAFGGREVIRNCSMTVEKGSIYGFMGKNGAGKTTVFKILLGLLQPTAGAATVLGMDSVKQNLDILKRTGSLIETPIFYEHLSATENLQIHLDYMGITNSDIIGTLEMVGLPKVGAQPVSTFSLGMRQRLAIARALIHKPELLILDEPVNGLDPVGIREMRELLCNLVKEREITILLSSHILSEIEQTANRIGVIVNGTVVQEVIPQEIRKRYAGGLEEYFMTITKGGNENE